MTHRQFHLGLDVSAAAGQKTGVEYYILRLYQALRDHLGDRLTAFTRTPIPELPQAQLLASRLPPPLWRQWSLPRGLGRFGVTSLHVPVTAIPLCSPTPVVATIHDLCYRTPGCATSALNRSVQRFWCAAALRRADAVLAVSAATGSKLANIFPAQAHKIRIILSGALANPAPVAGSADAPLPAGLDDRTPFFLQLGRLDQRKSPLTTLEAFRLCALDGVRLVLAGSPGDATGAIDRWLAQHPEIAPRVLLCGYQPAATVARLLQQARALIYPSLDEGFGHPPLEALQAGTPPVVSDLPVLREVLAGAALFVPPAAPAALAEAMRRTLTDTEGISAILRAGRERLRLLDWRETASKVIALHQQLSGF